MWFVNLRDEGIIFDEWFGPALTKELLALVLTAVRHTFISGLLY